MAYTVILTRPAEAALNRLPPKPRKRVIDALLQLQTRPRPAGCVKLKGIDSTWRIRVGDFRVVYQVQDDALVVLVVRIGDRKDIYRGQ